MTKWPQAPFRFNQSADYMDFKRFPAGSEKLLLQGAFYFVETFFLLPICEICEIMIEVLA